MNENGVNNLINNEKNGRNSKGLVITLVLIIFIIMSLLCYEFVLKDNNKNLSEVKSNYLKVSDSNELIIETINDEDDGKHIAKIIVDKKGNVYIEGEFKNNSVSDKIGKLGDYKIENYDGDTSKLYKTDFNNIKSVYAYKDKNNNYNIILIKENNKASVITLQVDNTSINDLDVYKDIADDIITITKTNYDEYLLVDKNSKKYVINNDTVKEVKVEYTIVKSSYTESEVIVDENGFVYLFNNNVKDNVLNKISEKGTYKSFKIDEKEDMLYKLNINNIRDVYYIEENNKEIIALISKDNKLSIITFTLDDNGKVIDAKEQKEIKDNIITMTKIYNGTKYEYKFVTANNKLYEFIIDEDKTITEKPKNSIGDVNLDGIIDIFDAVRIQKYINKQIELTKEAIDNADINKDGKINNIDMNLLKKYLSGNIKELPYTKYKAGDVDLDGEITSKDSIIIKRYIDNVSGTTITTEGLINADVNLDGEINDIDANLLRKYLMGYKIELPYTKYKAGDVDLDGEITSKDSIIIKRYINNVSGTTITTEGLINADVNLDGEVDNNDAEIIRKYLLGGFYDSLPTIQK